MLLAGPSRYEHCEPTDTGAMMKAKIAAEFPELADVPLRLSYKKQRKNKKQQTVTDYKEIPASKTAIDCGIDATTWASDGAGIEVKRQNHAKNEELQGQRGGVKPIARPPRPVVPGGRGGHVPL